MSADQIKLASSILAADLARLGEQVAEVNPGFGHQSFNHSTSSKINRVRQMVERINAGCEVEVEGGVYEETASLAVAAGANVLVAGSVVFGNSARIASSISNFANASQIAHSGSY